MSKIFLRRYYYLQVRQGKGKFLYSFELIINNMTFCLFLNKNPYDVSFYDFRKVIAE